MIGLAKCSFILYGFHGFINPHFIPCKCPLMFTMKLMNMTYLMLSRKNIVSHCLGFPGVYSFVFFSLTRLLLLIFSPSLLKKIYLLKLLICHMLDWSIKLCWCCINIAGIFFMWIIGTVGLRGQTHIFLFVFLQFQSLWPLRATALKHQCKANQLLHSFKYEQSHATVVIMIKTYNRLITWLPLFCTQPNQKSTAEF